LQKFDDPVAEVAGGDDRQFVMSAAISVYHALVPSLLTDGEQALRHLRNDNPHDKDDFHPTLPNRLRGAEWNIAIYERTHVDTPDDPSRDSKPVDEFIAWIGPTLDVPLVR